LQRVPRRLLAATLLTLAPLTASAQVGDRLIDTFDATDGERNVNIYVQFRCSIQYLSHAPLDFGSSVTIRLRPGVNCGAAPGSTERPLLSGLSTMVKSARLEEAVPGTYELQITWTKDQHFVLAPSTNARGIRLRLLDVFQGPRGTISVKEGPDAASGYAINLESATEKFSDADLDAASKAIGMPVRISTIELEGRVWYRLRIGPIAGRRDAERLLASTQAKYPRAWLAIDDEAPQPGDALTVPPEVGANTVVDPPLPAKERAALLETARVAMSRRKYPQAIEQLTKLIRQPEYPQRARAQELLGLARERSGQLAHAKAEYQEYLRRYPQGEAASRIRQRLRLLASASRVGRSGTLLGGEGDADKSWQIDGGLTQFYRWERAELTTAGETSTQQSQNAVYTDADLLARHRGENLDVIARFSGGYAKDLLPAGTGDQVRVSAAYVELNKRELGLDLRFGRQSRSSGGLLGTFDGLFGSYQWRPRVNLSAAAGFPVESTRDGPKTERQFVGLAAEFGPFKEKWDYSLFTVSQRNGGQVDRLALGLEGRYFVPGRTLIGVLDYDIHYQTLNSLTLLGNLQLPARWTLSANLDHRRAPVLTTRNALIGQPVATLRDLLGLFSPSEIEQLAQDRTPQSDLVSLSVGRPLGERFQLSIDAFGYRTGELPASGGVAALPALPFDKTLQLQLSGSSLARSSDLWALSLRYQNSPTQTIESLGLAARLPIGGAWRLGPRLRVDRRTGGADVLSETLVLPTLRLDYQRGNSWFELEGGAELGKRTLPADEEKTKRYYFGLGYRFGF
jgi:tetratricopeptide (TPR) repeat protein